jgi:hypothetical protein
MSGIGNLIQAALRRTSIVRSSVGGRQRRIGAARRRRNRRRRNGGGGAGSGCGSRGSRRAGWCTGHRASIGRHVLSLLVSDELLVSRRAGPRRYVLGHAAGPGRPGIGDKSGERTARPERQADAKCCRQREQALGRAGRQIRTSMPLGDEPARSRLSYPTPAKSFLNGHRPQKRSAFMAGLCRPKG